MHEQRQWKIDFNYTGGIFHWQWINGCDNCVSRCGKRDNASYRMLCYPMLIVNRYLQLFRKRGDLCW